MSTTTTTTNRRQGGLTTGEAHGLLSLALLSKAEIKGLGYREIWVAEQASRETSEYALHFVRELPLDRVAQTYIRWRREDGRAARRQRLRNLAISFLVGTSYPIKNAREKNAVAQAQRELIGYALVKLKLGHLTYAKRWRPKRRRLNAGGAND